MRPGEKNKKREKAASHQFGPRTEIIHRSLMCFASGCVLFASFIFFECGVGRLRGAEERSALRKAQKGRHSSAVQRPRRTLLRDTLACIASQRSAVHGEAPCQHAHSLLSSCSTHVRACSLTRRAQLPDSPAAPPRGSRPARPTPPPAAMPFASAGAATAAAGSPPAMQTAATIMLQGAQHTTATRGMEEGGGAATNRRSANPVA